MIVAQLRGAKFTLSEDKYRPKDLDDLYIANNAFGDCADLCAGKDENDTYGNMLEREKEKILKRFK